MVWLQPLLLTLQLMALSVAIAAVMGIVGAWSATTLQSGGRLEQAAGRFFLAAMVLTAALPMILHAAAWEATAGKFGWMFLTQTGSRGDASGPYAWFSGLVACGWIHGLVGGSLVAIACWHGTRSVSVEVNDHSRVDLPPLGQWWQIRMPIASRWWLPALLATAMLAATEMTVVDLYGYRTLADEFYLFYAASPSLTSVAMTCVVPLVILCVALAWWSVSRRRFWALRPGRDLARSTGDSPGRWWHGLALCAALGVALTMALVPITGLVIKVGHEVTVEQDRIIAIWSPSACLKRIGEAPGLFAEEYGWTLLLSAATAIVALTVAWPMASLARSRPHLERLLDLVTIGLAVIPGPIVAMSIVTVFQWDLPGFRFLYQQTIVPTVLALLARGIPVAYWILRAAYRGLERSLLDAASLDMSWTARMWKIDRPMVGTNLLSALLVTAVVASGDVPAALPVIPPGVSTVGTRLFGLLHSGARYQEAALAIWYVAAITVICLFLLRRPIAGRVRLK